MVATTVVQSTAMVGWDDLTSWVALARGPYGELLPPSLCAELSPEEVKAELAAAGLSAASPAQARVLLQQLYLRQALAGQREADDLARELREAVMEQHVPLSLRPLGLEDLECTGFAPVVTYLGGVAWRVGISGQGRLEFLVANDPAHALAQAQQVFARWYNENGGTMIATPPWEELLSGGAR